MNKNFLFLGGHFINFFKQPWHTNTRATKLIKPVMTQQGTVLQSVNNHTHKHKRYTGKGICYKERNRRAGMNCTGLLERWPSFGTALLRPCLVHSDPQVACHNCCFTWSIHWNVVSCQGLSGPRWFNICITVNTNTEWRPPNMSPKNACPAFHMYYPNLHIYAELQNYSIWPQLKANCNEILDVF